MLSVNFPLSKSFYRLGRFVTIAFLASMGIACGVIPSIDTSKLEFNFNLTAQAQDFTAQEVTNYAKAVLQIEKLRQQAYKDIQQIIAKQPPDIVCNDSDSFSSLPANAKKIATTFCQTSKKIVENSGLSVAQFNSITSTAQTNKNLERRIQEAMLQIQQ